MPYQGLAILPIDIMCKGFVVLIASHTEGIYCLNALNHLHDSVVLVDTFVRLYSAGNSLHAGCAELLIPARTLDPC